MTAAAAACMTFAAQAQTSVDTIMFESAPAIVSGIPIGSTEQAAAPLPIPEDGEVEIVTRQLGSTTVREHKHDGRLLYIEVVPENGAPYYINHGGGLLDEHRDSFVDETNRVSHSWQITRW